MSDSRREVLDSASVERCLRRLASEIVDGMSDGETLALVGIRRGGVPLANRLADLIEESEGARPRLGAIDITLYRDDLYTGLEKPSFGETSLPFNMAGTGIVLVDDVLFTGRTIRAALGVIHDFGRPRWIRLAVVVDRGHRELPIQADYVGRTVETELSDRVSVVAGDEAGGDDAVFIDPGASR